ncbi:MAG: alpha/beta fold hydrolase [Pirellulales bacterium]|nr:alpha/beta fold hydrolase [Pirellulales bacterium]
MKSKTIQIVCCTAILLTALGFAGCANKAEQAAAPDEAVAPDQVPASDDRVEKTSPTEKAVPDVQVAPGTDPSMGAIQMAREPEPQPTTTPQPKETTEPRPKELIGLRAKSMPAPVMLKSARSNESVPPDESTPPDESMQPAARESGDDVPAPVATAAPPSTEPTPAATEVPKDYVTVKVFYGTNRKAINDEELHPLGKIPFGYLTAAVGGLTALLLLIYCFGRRSRLIRLAAVVSLLATVALGVCMFQIPRNTKPDEADTSLKYGSDRGELAMGTCDVSIPKDHEVGVLEGPSILSLEFNEDPEKHIVLMDVERQEPGTFYEQLSRRIAQSAGKEAFVFIHGYNVTFENAARRTAQLAHDLKFDGAPIFYSWPSRGGLLQYTVDEQNAAWTVPDLKEFLLGVARKTDARRVHLIAHSMGNRALTAALASLSYEMKDDKPLFHEVLLTAPDIDADVFKRDIAPAIVKTAQRVTLYASSNDNALVASKKVHGYPRAGESGENIVIVEGIDTIDVSAADTSLLGHSYYGDSDTVIVDMAQLLHEGKPPGLRSRLQKMVGYWVFLTNKMGLRSDQPDL